MHTALGDEFQCAQFGRLRRLIPCYAAWISLFFERKSEAKTWYFRVNSESYA